MNQEKIDFDTIIHNLEVECFAARVTLLQMRNVMPLDQYEAATMRVEQAEKLMRVLKGMRE